MNVITNQQLANSAKECWKDQYCGQRVWYNDDKRLTYEKLVELGDNPSPDDVNEVIGNNSWTLITCSECSESVDSVVILGVVDYDSEHVYACKDCLTKALELF